VDIHFAASANNAQCDFSPIGNEYFFKHKFHYNPPVPGEPGV
jgi:hypothetical protein